MPAFRKILLTAAVALSCLGAGNIIFGNSRLSEYQANLAIQNYPSEPESTKKLVARMNYYEFVVFGGKCFLALAALCFVGGAFSRE